MQTETNNSGGSPMGEKKTFEAIPAGRYTVTLDRVTLKESKRVNGCWMINPTYKVAEGPYAGRLIFNKHVIEHPTSAKAVEISQERLDGFLKAAGEEDGLDALAIANRDDYLNLDKFKNKLVVATVKVNVDKSGTYKPQNEATSFSAR